MNAVGTFILVAALLLALDYAMPSSIWPWPGYDLFGEVEARYRRKFPRRAVVIFIGASASALAVAVSASEWAEIIITVSAFVIHGAVALYDVIRCRSST